MLKKLVATGALIALLAVPTFADTFVRTFTIGNRTIVITTTYTDSNGNGRIDTLQELRSITNIQITIR